jgi:hypothetical protein
MPIRSVMALLVLLAAAPAAAEVPAGTYVYKVNHSRYGAIGTHTIALGGTAQERIANVVLKLQVKVLFITAHRETAQRSEVWRGGQMVAYSSTTTENKDNYTVSARTVNGQLAITTSSSKGGGLKKYTAPLGTFPTNPWNVGILKAKTVMDTKTGEVKPVTKVALEGQETVTTGKGPVKAKKYLFEAGTKRFLWFDASGRLVQFQVFNEGDTVTFTLQ